MTKEALERIKTAEGEADLCKFIILVLSRESSRELGEFVKDGNVALRHNSEACDYAIKYVENWKNSL